MAVILNGVPINSVPDDENVVKRDDTNDRLYVVLGEKLLSSAWKSVDRKNIPFTELPRWSVGKTDPIEYGIRIYPRTIVLSSRTYSDTDEGDYTHDGDGDGWIGYVDTEFKVLERVNIISQSLLAFQIGRLADEYGFDENTETYLD